MASRTRHKAPRDATVNRPARTVDDAPSEGAPGPRAPAVTPAEWAIAAAILLLAASLRVAGAVNDLWLDEIWSLDMAREMGSALDVFTLHHDNNHHLNTLWMYMAGPDANPFRYRLLSILAGVGTVAAAGWIGRRRDVATATIAMLLTGSSYVLVLFGSEARGYSLLVLWALVAYGALESFLERPRWQTGLVYALAAVFGIASHSTFASVLGAACVWSAYHLARTIHPRSRAALTWVGVQALPVATFLALYLIDLRQLVEGQGTRTASLIDAYGASLAAALWSSRAARMQLGLCILSVCGLVAGLRLLQRPRTRPSIFFGGVIVAFPIALVILRQADFVYLRYFLVAIAFLLMLLAYVLASWWQRGALGKTLCAAVLLTFLAFNISSVAELARLGRGTYRDALTFMAEKTPAAVITVGGDHDIRVGVVIAYHAPRLGLPKQFTYLEEKAWPPGGPDWVVGHRESFEPPDPRSRELFDSAGNRYELAATFPSANLSGLHWFLYRNVRVSRSGG